MAKKKSTSPEEVVRKRFPKFDVVATPSQDDAFLPPDSITPDVQTLHRKYSSDSPEEAILEKADAASDADATQAVVIEPKEKGDAAPKRLTVLVKKGKIRAVQG
jgi:hypothetical protein